MDVTREEFNKLGERVTAVRESQVKCQAETGQRMTNLEETTTRIDTSLSRLWEKMDVLEIKVSSMWAKITAGVAVAMLFIQIGIKLLMG